MYVKITVRHNRCEGFAICSLNVHWGEDSVFCAHCVFIVSDNGYMILEMQCKMGMGDYKEPASSSRFLNLLLISFVVFPLEDIQGSTCSH